MLLGHIKTESRNPRSDIALNMAMETKNISINLIKGQVRSDSVKIVKSG
jgi:hypothetical protein